MDGKISSIESASNLKKKYDKKSLVVKYLEGGLENQQIFSMEEVKNHEFHSLLSDKAILSITTKNVLDNEIFKLETGVEL
jgi:hypothetical protein